MSNYLYKSTTTLKHYSICNFFTLLIATLFAGCSSSRINHNYYTPNSIQTPLFKEKNELRVLGSVGGGDGTSMSEGHVAYSVDKNIGLMGNIAFGRDNQNGIGSYKSHHTEFAVGYFKNFKEFGIFEVYAGLGPGKQVHEFFEKVIYDTTYYIFPFSNPEPIYHYRDEKRGKANLNHFKYFIQSSYGLSYNGFDIALNVRLSSLNFYKIENRAMSNLDKKEVDYIIQKNNLMFFEPGFVLRGGWKYLKLQLNYTYTNILSNANPRISSSNLNIGLYLTVAKRFMEKQIQQ